MKILKNKSPHVAVYVRVSTKDQAEEGLSMEAQPASCIKKLDDTFGTGMYTYEVFEDPGKSGALGPKPWASEIKSKERKGLWLLIQKVRQGEFTHVIAFRSDRLYRDQLGFLGFCADLLKPKGVKLLLVAEDINETLEGELTAGMLATIAEFQRKQIGQNISRTLAHRRSQGYYLGYPPFGWRNEREGEYEGRRPNIVPVEAHIPTILRIRDLFFEGHSIPTIARLLNQDNTPHQRGRGRWAHGSVTKVLTCPIHAGLIPVDQDKNLGRGIHYEHRLYDEEVYHAILARLDKRKKRLKGPASGQPFRMFRGLAYCGRCGALMHSQFNQPSPNYLCMGDRLTEDGSHVYINAGRLEAAVLEVVCKIATRTEVVREASFQIEETVDAQDNALRTESKHLRLEIRRLEEQTERLASDLSEGELTPKLARMTFEKLESKIADHNTRLLEVNKNLEGRQSRRVEIERAKNRLMDFPLLWKRMTMTERRELLHIVIERIEVYAEPERKYIRIAFTTGDKPVEVEILKGVERYRSTRLDGPSALTPRELAALSHRLDGANYKKISAYFETTISNACNILTRATAKVGAANSEEAAKKMAKTIKQFRSQLPLYGPVRSNLKAKALKVSEYQVLIWAEKGKSIKETAEIVEAREDRIEELLQSAYKRTGCKDAKSALKKVKGDREHLPFVLQFQEEAS